MTLLFRYLCNLFLRSFTAVIAGFAAIYLLADFFERIDNFIETNRSFGLAAQYFFWKMPLILEQLLPVAVLLAGILTLGILLHTREFQSLQGGGISLANIILPLFAGAVLVSLIGMAMSQWVKPTATTIADQIWYEEVGKTVPSGIIRNGRVYYRGRNGLYGFRPAAAAGAYDSFSYAEWNSRYEIARLLTADAAVWSPAGWTLSRGVAKTRIAETGDYQVEYFTERAFELPDTPAEFFVPPYRPEEQSLTQLLNRAEKDPLHRQQAALDLHSRVSYLLLGLPLLLLGIPIFLLLSHRWGRSIALAVPVSCAIAFGAWGWWGAAQSLAKAEYIGPFIASWAIHLLAGPAGLWLIKRENGE